MSNSQSKNPKLATKADIMKRCFMIYHYDERDRDSHLINDAAASIFKAHGYSCERMNLAQCSGTIMDRVAVGILHSDIIYVNISADPPNPNVYYELGVAHAMSKRTIVVADEETVNSLPFDISGVGVLTYDTAECDTFKYKLDDSLEKSDAQIESDKVACDDFKNPLSSTLVNGASSEIMRLVFSNVTGSAKHPLTALLLKFSSDKTLWSARIDSVSSKAKEFYGYATCSNGLKGQTTSELLGRLRNYIDEEDFQAFVKDQERIGQCIRADQTLIPGARIPIIFNDNHPSEAFRNKSFLPIWVATMQTRDQYQGDHLASVLYIEVSELPLCRLDAQHSGR